MTPFDTKMVAKKKKFGERRKKKKITVFEKKGVNNGVKRWLGMQKAKKTNWHRRSFQWWVSATKQEPLNAKKRSQKHTSSLTIQIPEEKRFRVFDPRLRKSSEDTAHDPKQNSSDEETVK